MKKTQPFFSIVIITFNRTKYLKRAIESILKQSFRGFEIIVVNNGGNKEAGKIVKLFDFPIKYYKISKLNLGMARNFGLYKAQAEWTGYLDDDDEYLPNHLQVRYDIINKRSNLDLLYNGFKTIGDRLVPDLLNKGRFLHVDDPFIFHAGTMVVKTKKAKKIGGFKNITTKDYSDNFFEVAKKAKFKMFRVKLRTYLYHRHKDSITMRYKNKKPS